MSRFVNAVLISILAFFVFVGVFWQVMGDGADGRTPGSAPTVTAVEARWQPEEEREMLIELTVHNPSSLSARATAISYRAEVDGKLVDSAVSRPLDGDATRIEGKSDSTIEILVDLPDDFILTWWPTYMAEEEKADLSVQGSVDVRRDDGDREATFEWRSSWEGDLAERLSDAVANCASGEDDVCIGDASFFWKDGALHADLGFRNPGSDPVGLHNMTITLLFAERAVVAGEVDLARQLAPDGEAEVGIALTFSQNAMAAWWPDHLARCERTPVALRIGLETEVLHGGNETDPSTVQWTFPASSFQTRFVCAP